MFRLLIPRDRAFLAVPSLTRGATVRRLHHLLVGQQAHGRSVAVAARLPGFSAVHFAGQAKGNRVGNRVTGPLVLILLRKHWVTLNFLFTCQLYL